MNDLTPEEAIANLNHLYGMVAPDIQKSLDVAFKTLERTQGEYIRKEDVIALLNKWADGYSYIEIPTEDAIKAIMEFNPSSYAENGGK